MWNISFKVNCRTLVIIFMFLHSHIKVLTQEYDNPCVFSDNSKETCGDCIRKHSSCAWCSVEVSPIHEPKDGTVIFHSQCDLKENLVKKCSPDNLEYARSKVEVLLNKKLSEKSVKGQDDIVQIKPQRLKLRIGPNIAQDIEVEYRQAEDYPVDLYFLMDVSNSMSDDKETLARLGSRIADDMGKITKDFQLGFGSFVDKPAIPFSYNGKLAMEENCKRTGQDCKIPFSFHHQVKMTTNVQLFADTVRKADITGNLDAPEGGSDALIQAIECKKQVGWRNASRKIILFATDDAFHFAGDGKLAGIVLPNDGKCHLDNQNYYTESLVQDYPSISMIDRKARKNKVIIIFAVLEGKLGLYRKLSRRIEGSTAAVLAKDSSNIVDLVREQYNNLSSKIELKHDQGDDHLKITYYSKCRGKEERQTNICDGLKVGESVKYRIQIELTSCPVDRKDWNRTITIYPVGVNEKLVVDLEMQCSCDCESPLQQEPDSEKCHYGNGTYECGICNCYPGRYGKFCQCGASRSLQSAGDLNSTDCYNVNDTVACSGHGSCICGVCQCDTIPGTQRAWGGAYCQCDNGRCDAKDGKLCNGKGECSCGKCRCTSGWSGLGCDCNESLDPCIPKEGRNKEPCSGNGKCVCGECKCTETEDITYGGQYCEECLTCLAGQCDVYKDCVECELFQSGSLANTNCSSTECDTIEIMQVDKAEAKGKKEQLCSALNENGCRFYFVYKRDNQERPIILAQKKPECPKPLNVLAVALGVVGGILLVGIVLLLIWKLITSIHDKREYARFLNESKSATWGTADNPLYQPSTSTFSNPAFSAK